MQLDLLKIQHIIIMGPAIRICDTSFSEIQITNWIFSDILSPDENFGLSLIFDSIDSSNLEIKNTIFDNLKTRISFQIENSSVIFYKY
jgi:hypothetical protein